MKIELKHFFFSKLVNYDFCFCNSVLILIEMLNIFKNYGTDMSILDDFDYYEERQKAMQERKARKQAGLMAVGVVGDNEHINVVALSGDFIKQMSKSFAQVVRMDEGSKEFPLMERATFAQMSKTLPFLSCFVLFLCVLCFGWRET